MARDEIREVGHFGRIVRNKPNQFLRALGDEDWSDFGLWTTSTNKHLACDSSVYPPWLQGRSPSAVVGIGHCKEIDFQLTKLCIFWRFPSVT